MKVNPEIITPSGLQFYGKMTASISHEIKNVLAIINENAGLLEDLALMADRGGAIEPQRLQNMSQVLMKQVRRADVIAKNMNSLAHSVDDPAKRVDVNALLKLLLALSDRFASMRGVAIQPQLTNDPLEIQTAPFFLLNLLWLCLDFAMDAAGEEKTIELVTRKTDAGVGVFFKGLGGLAGAREKPFPTEPEKGLCGVLGAEMEVNSGKRELVVRISK
jgi:signal transduction histidine kinase